MSGHFNILGVKVSSINLPLACRTIEQWIDQRKKEYVCIAPVSTIVECLEDNQYKSIINDASMTTPDGMPLVWIAKKRRVPEIDRTYGPDLMRAMCEISQKKSYKHYFYGGTKDTIERMIKNLKQEFPSLPIVGYFAPGMQEKGTIEREEVLEKINQSNPDIVWIGLGSPKQDYWMHNHRNRLNAPVLVGAGAAFDYAARVKPQAPRWMQRSGLEWVFRLFCEPKRLWKRYLIGNSKFLYYLIKERLGKKAAT